MATTSSRRRPVSTGLDTLLLDPHRLEPLRTARVGLLANPASVTRDFVHAADALTASGVRPARLFGPEHGVRGEAQDMVSVESTPDPLTAIPAVSLYGRTLDSLRPRPEHLEGLDVMLVDLQDVGARYYTYVYTAMLAVEACTEAGIPVVVLDRPNPIGGAVEGPAVDDGFASFVGMLPLPTRHGLTLSEVLRFAGGARRLEFETVPVQGWDRTMWADDHDAPWVLPSPNMPTLDTACVYPGLCLLEGTNASEGRGTTRPFELFGAPYVDATRLARALAALDLPGVCFRLASFEPTFQKWARHRCSGLQLHVTDRASFQPVRTGAAIVWALYRECRPHFAWRRDAYEFVEDIPAIDLLFGSARIREAIEGGASFAEIDRALQTPPSADAEIAAARRPEYAPGGARGGAPAPGPGSPG